MNQVSSGMWNKPVMNDNMGLTGAGNPKASSFHNKSNILFVRACEFVLVSGAISSGIGQWIYIERSIPDDQCIQRLPVDL